MNNLHPLFAGNNPSLVGRATIHGGIVESENVASFADMGPGKYSIHWGRPFRDDKYGFWISTSSGVAEYELHSDYVNITVQTKDGTTHDPANFSILAIQGPPPPSVAESQRVVLAGVEWDFRNLIGTYTSGGEMFAFVFSPNARNLTGKPIETLKGHLRSNINSKVYKPLYLQSRTPDGKDNRNVLPEQTHGIPVDAKFAVVIPFKGISGTKDDMMKEAEFLETMSDFTFAVEVNGERAERRFPRDEVLAFWSKRKAELFPPPTPGVVMK